MGQCTEGITELFQFGGGGGDGGRWGRIGPARELEPEGGNPLGHLTVDFASKDGPLLVADHKQPPGILLVGIHQAAAAKQHRAHDRRQEDPDGEEDGNEERPETVARFWQDIPQATRQNETITSADLTLRTASTKPRSDDTKPPSSGM